MRWADWSVAVAGGAFAFGEASASGRWSGKGAILYFEEFSWEATSLVDHFYTPSLVCGELCSPQTKVVVRRMRTASAHVLASARCMELRRMLRAWRALCSQSFMRSSKVSAMSEREVAV